MFFVPILQSIALLLVISCTSGHVSEFVQRGDHLFEIQSRGPKNAVGEFFFITSHKLCFERFQLGFELLHWSVSKSDEVHGIVECKGKPVTYWKNRIDPRYDEIKESKSRLFEGGGRFNFSLDELQNQGIRVR
jgi:hypothetical protein